MISHHSGDIFKVKVDAVVNAVNCVGVMGKGMALQFKKIYPAAYLDYRAECKSGKLTPGHLLIAKLEMGPPFFVIQFPTKQHWRDSSNYNAIEIGMEALRTWLLQSAITSIALPELGCGNGGLQWPLVLAIVERYLADLDGFDIRVYHLGSSICSKPLQTQPSKSLL